MPRRKGRSSNVSAAIAGSEEVVAELSGDESAAQRFGRAEKSMRDGSPRRRGDPSGRSTGGSPSTKTIFDSVLTSAALSVVPRPIIYDMLTGRRAGTELYRDRVFPVKVPVIIPQVAVPQWEGVAKAHWFQSSTTNVDATVDNVIGGEELSLYSAIVRELASHKGKLFAIRDTTLANGGTFNSLPGWLNMYTEAFCILRGLQSCLSGGGLNYTMQIIANSVMQSLPRLTADLNRLVGFSVPPKLIDALDRICGVKYIDTDNTVYIAGLAWFGTTAALTDLGLNATVNNLLASAEAQLTALITGAGGSSAITAADAQEISNIFSYAYGDPRIRLEKGVSSDPVEYSMQKFQVYSASAAGGNCWSWPNSNVATVTNGIPIMVPKGTRSSDSLHQLFSLLRPSVYSVDPTTGVATNNAPNQVGIFSNATSGGTANWGTSFGYYSQGGAFTFVKGVTTGTAPTYALPELEGFPWSSESEGEAADYTLDFRQMLGYDRIIVNKDWLLEETILWINSMFVDPLRTSGGVRV